MHMNPSLHSFLATLILAALGLLMVMWFYADQQELKKGEGVLKNKKDELDQELNFLKNHFHAHLTFDFLNFCYKRIGQVSVETAASVEEFLYILRYSVNQKSDQYVSLRKEIEFIENFISFQQRLTNELYVDFKYDGDQTIRILPRILIVYIENAFKHGVLHDADVPVKIQVESDGKALAFQVHYKKNHQRNILESGGGLDNVQRILQLFYPGKHVLNIINNEERFSCDLKLVATG